MPSAQRTHQRFALRFLVFFQNRAAAHHHVAALAIQFQHAYFDLFIFPRIQVVHRPQFNLRSRQERPHADIHHKPALDPLRYFALDRRVLAIRLLDALPHAPPMRAHVRQQHVPIFLRVQTLHFNRLPCSEFNRAARIHKFLRGDQSFELPAHVHNHSSVSYRQHVPIENFAFGCRGLGHRELLHQLIHRLRGFGGFGGFGRRRTFRPSDRRIFGSRPGRFDELNCRRHLCGIGRFGRHGLACRAAWLFGRTDGRRRCRSFWCCSGSFLHRTRLGRSRYSRACSRGTHSGGANAGRTARRLGISFPSAAVRDFCGCIRTG